MHQNKSVQKFSYSFFFFFVACIMIQNTCTEYEHFTAAARTKFCAFYKEIRERNF